MESKEKKEEGKRKAQSAAFTQPFQTLVKGSPRTTLGHYQQKHLGKKSFVVIEASQLKKLVPNKSMF